MTRTEAIAKLVASGKYTEASAAAALDARKAPAPKPPAPKTVVAPKTEAKKPAPVDHTASAAPSDVAVPLAWHGPDKAPGTYGLGGARHRLEDREDAALVARQSGNYSTYNRINGWGNNAQDVASDIGESYARANAEREDRAKQLDAITSAPGQAARWIGRHLPSGPERRDDLADEIARHPAPKAGPNPLDLANAWTARSIELAKNGPRPASPSPGFTPTQTFEVGETAAQKRAKLETVFDTTDIEDDRLDAYLARPDVQAALK